MDKTYVYFIAAGTGDFDTDQFFKVGIAADVKKRLAQLQTGNHLALEIAWQIAVPRRKIAARIEREVHNYLEAYRVSGEWFLCSFTVAARALPCAVNIFQRELGLNSEREVLTFIGYPTEMPVGAN